ncbi:MAG: hypothetical protein KatS3mg029_0309 [Saprospiraceae bacterium]|nr:MAG: hypothetical protein KatS3mg029_0309 [Saprospiraceae bacterium]
MNSILRKFKLFGGRHYQAPQPPVEQTHLWELCMMTGYLNSMSFNKDQLIDTERGQQIIEEELRELSRKLPFCNSSQSYEMMLNTLSRIEYRLSEAQHLIKAV